MVLVLDFDLVGKLDKINVEMEVMVVDFYVKGLKEVEGFN